MIAIRCTLIRDVFEGGRPDDPRRAEWPPSWMRVFSALVSVAEPGSGDDDVLRALEAAPAPAILASDHRPLHRRAYVPTNARASDSGGHTVWPGRTNSERGWARTVPRSRDIWYRWQSLDLPAGGRERLEALCRRVPYLGRSTSPAIVEVRDDSPESDKWLLPDLDGRQLVRVTQPVRTPYAGSLEALREAYEEKHLRGGAGAVWQIGDGVDYGYAEPEEKTEVVAGPYETVIVFRQPANSRRRLDGRHAAKLSYAIRRTLMSRVGDKTPLEEIPSLHGHHEGSTVQCAIAGLPNVGHEHARGQLLGFALCIPDLPQNELFALAQALPAGGEALPVKAGKLGELDFERVSPLDASGVPRGLTDERWRGPAKRWVTALPMVFDRFLKRTSHVDDEVRRAVRNAGYPEPKRVHVTMHGQIDGALILRPRDTLRRPEDKAVKPYRHAAIEFAGPVRGPVIIGSMRHYGLGLCVPADLREEARDDQ